MESIANCPCGRPALPTDPEGLCERCVLASHGVDVADGERWEWGRLFGEQLEERWRGYTVDYIGRIYDQEPTSGAPVLTHERGPCVNVTRDRETGKYYTTETPKVVEFMELWLQRVFHQGTPTYAEIVWTPEHSTRAAIRGIENAQGKPDIDRAWDGFILLGNFNQQGRPLGSGIPVTQEEVAREYWAYFNETGELPTQEKLFERFPLSLRQFKARLRNESITWPPTRIDG